jgi:long-chain acyl-CoA synthetase
MLRTGDAEGERKMSNRHWLAELRRIPSEIDPDAYSSVLEMLEGAMRRYADKPAFRCFGQTLTYADTDRLSRHFAAYLQSSSG